MKVIYLIGSLRNPEIPVIGNRLREYGFEVFDEWFGAGKIADDSFQDYNNQRGLTYKQALQTYAAKHIFNFDLIHLKRADLVVMAMPTGRSGHLEFGYCVGQGKPSYMLFDKVPERYDLMAQFATDIYFNVDELGEYLRNAYIYRRSNEGSEGLQLSRLLCGSQRTS